MKKRTTTLANLCLAASVALALGMTTSAAFAKDKDKEKDKNKDNKPAVAAVAAGAAATAAAKPMSGTLATWKTDQDIPQLGKVKVNGSMSYNVGNLSTNNMGFTNKVSFKGVEVNYTCQAVVTSKSTVCVNLIKRSVEGANGSDVSCEITGASGKIDLPADPKLNVCTDFKMTGSANQNPQGKIKIYAEAGGAGQYKSVSILTKEFK
jgi:hypothetical protein